MSTYRGLYWLKATKGTSRTGTERAQTLSALLGHMRGHNRMVAKMCRISGWILLLLAEWEGVLSEHCANVIVDGVNLSMYVIDVLWCRE
jgi:hypothetical protein